jgi:hypothetical protein
MLTEFLLTPEALSDSDGRDGTEVVRELKNCLFPFAAASTALVCKLGGEEWTRAASGRIARIADVNHRQLAMSLMTQIVQQLAVTRPAIQRHGDDEAGWIHAAMQSSAQVPLGRIVVSAGSTPPARLGASLKEFVSREFWEKLSNPRLVGRDVATQQGVLTAICTHSDWLLIRLPQIRGGSDDEIVTVKQIAALANQLPPGFRQSSIDLQICAMQNIPERNLIRSVTGELDSYIRRGVKITLTIWPERHFVNRELIGGEYAQTSNGTIVPKPLWWITMTHVAVRGRHVPNAGEGGNTWCLFSRQKAFERYEQIRADTLGKSIALQ